MKVIILTIAITFSLVMACSEPLVQEIISDPGKNNMKFIPEKPGSNDDIKLVVYDDCNYNIRSGITRYGKTIDIKKEFNGMMKRPCLIRNDTITIGKLTEGTYIIHYKLMDIAPVPPKAVISLAFLLPVSK